MTLFRITSQLNYSLCFKAVMVVSIFEYKVLYIFLKRSAKLKVKPLSLPQSSKTLLSQCVTLITLDSLEADKAPPTVCAPVSSSPQRRTVPGGGMLNQHVDVASTCVVNSWTGNIAWHLIFLAQNACLRVLDFIAFRKPLTIMSSTATCWLMGQMKTSDSGCAGLSSFMPSLIQAVHRGCLSRQWSEEMWKLCSVVAQCNWLIIRWRGQKCPHAKWEHPRNTVREKNRGIYCFVLLSFGFGTNETVFDVYKDDVKKFYKTESNRTYLSCK